jgi:putative flippase GtrA
MSHELVRFLLAGAANTLLSYLLYLLLLTFLTYLPAYSIAYCVGIVISYFMNVLFVFKNRVSLVNFLKFPIVYFIQYALGAVILWLLVGKAGVSPALAMIGVIIFTIPVTFMASRFVLKN